MKNGPIIIIEDDVDDKKIYEDIIRELGVRNEIIWLDDCSKAFHFLKESPIQPFIILSDVYMPGLNGIEFKRMIDEDPILRKKSIPFVFLSTTVTQEAVNAAYSEMTVQGYFQKIPSYSDLQKTMKTIMDYWKACTHPNLF